jgi:hypothetical protein
VGLTSSVRFGLVNGGLPSVIAYYYLSDLAKATLGDADIPRSDRVSLLFQVSFWERGVIVASPRILISMHDDDSKPDGSRNQAPNK